jgi:hypothetical protein
MTPLWLPEGLSRTEQVDAEPLCQRALAAWQRRTGANLGWQDTEDALQSGFNRSINAPWGLGRPRCKKCMRAEEKETP